MGHKHICEAPDTLCVQESASGWRLQRWETPRWWKLLMWTVLWHLLHAWADHAPSHLALNIVYIRRPCKCGYPHSAHLLWSFFSAINTRGLQIYSARIDWGDISSFRPSKVVLQVGFCFFLFCLVFFYTWAWMQSTSHSQSDHTASLMFGPALVQAAQRKELPKLRNAPVAIPESRLVIPPPVQGC